MSLPLRPFQQAALSRLREPGHLVCVAPTGSGKSRIYEEWIRERRPRTVIVGPLVALARQQAESLRLLGIPVFGRASGPSVVPRLPRNREFGIWMLSPESLPGALARLRQWRPEFLVMDECHSCWDWGESFRPALRHVLDLVGELGIERSLWLTATLPRAARALLEQRLPEPIRFQGGFELPQGLELKILKIPWPERAEALARWLELRPEAGIVFVATRSGAERVARMIGSIGRKVLRYHAGLSAEERLLIEQQLRRGEEWVLVATSAFGMGMHFPQLRWALLWQAPSSVLQVAQAIGRVGRGGAHAYAAIFWDDDDFRLVEWMVGKSEERARALREIRDFLHEQRDLSEVLG